MDAKPKRPTSVSIAAIVIGVYLVLMFFTSSRRLPEIQRNFREDPLATILAVPILLGVIACFLGAVWGILNGKSWARWLGAGLLAVMLIHRIIAHFSLKASLGPEPLGSFYLMLSLFSAVLFGYLIFVLVASADATAFFNRKGAGQVESDPPPPPTFDS